MSYQETIDYLFGLQKHGVKFGLANSNLLMELMGSPHKQFRSIHIAGTNGKGSTSAFLSRMLQAAGYRVGLYTSPHLVSFTERIRMNGVPITEEKVAELAARVRESYRAISADEGKGAVTPTFFEVTTAMAFTYFAEERIDIAVVETGMGGRLDATNVITPLVSVITNIDLEHTEFLGATLDRIAAEKAGIIKPEVPVVTGAVQQEVITVIEREAARKNAPVYRMTKDFSARNISSGRVQYFDYQGIESSHRGLRVTMLGRHQVGNACMAVAAVECLQRSGLVVPEKALRRSLEQTMWEGRMERVAERPDIYLDGAHNPASARVLADAVRDLKPAYRRLIMVMGILMDKDFRGIISHLAPLADRVVVTRPQYARAMDIDTLAGEVRAIHSAVDVAGTIEEAIARARREAREGDCILITGSLYTVGDARAALTAGEGAGSALKGLKG